MLPLIPNNASVVQVTGLHLTGIVGAVPQLAAVKGAQPTLGAPVGGP